MAKAKPKKKKLPLQTMVYAGRSQLRSGRMGHIFYPIVDSKINDDDALVFTGTKFGHFCIGSVYDIPKDKDGWLFGEYKFAEERDFEDSESLTKDWRCNEAIINEQSKSKKAAADSKKIELLSLKDIKHKMTYSKASDKKALYRAVMFYLQGGMI